MRRGLSVAGAFHESRAGGHTNIHTHTPHAFLFVRRPRTWRRLRQRVRCTHTHTPPKHTNTHRRCVECLLQIFHIKHRTPSHAKQRMPTHPTRAHSTLFQVPQVPHKEIFEEAAAARLLARCCTEWLEKQLRASVLQHERRGR